MNKINNPFRNIKTIFQNKKAALQTPKARNNYGSERMKKQVRQLKQKNRWELQKICINF